MRRVVDLWRLLNLTCEGMSELASASMDRALSPTERFALGSHVLYCTACRRFRRQIVLVQRAVRRFSTEIERDTDGPALPDEVRERIKRALRDS